MMKAFAKSWLYRSGVTLQLMRRCRQPWVLMLHGIDPDDLPVEAFRRLLEFCGRHFEPVALADLLELPAQGAESTKWVGKPLVALTFDDGLRNNLLLAAPELRSRNIPATFYICPGQIDRSAWIWTYEVRARLADWDQRALEPFLRAACPASEGDLERFVRCLKASSPTVLASLLEKVWQATPDFRPSARQRDAFDLMTWDEVRQLKDPLFSIGSHTLTHQTLETGSAAEFELEIGTACNRIGQEGLAHPADFCYPDGRYCAEAIEIVRKHHRSAVTTQAAVVPTGFDRWLIPRVGAVPSLAEMAWRLIRAARAKAPLDR
jgi:peptidoglycan/xylan/chitin deacetylase (PgdA/CDA1 family)